MPSTIWYVVENTSEESVVIDGLGVLPPKTTMEIARDGERAENFKTMRGLALHLCSMPAGVEISMRVGD